MEQVKPYVGMKVRPKKTFKKNPKEWDGIIVVLIEPSETDHGLLQTWLTNKDGYGGDNCEHYAYEGVEMFHECFKILK